MPAHRVDGGLCFVSNVVRVVEKLETQFVGMFLVPSLHLARRTLQCRRVFSPTYRSVSILMPPKRKRTAVVDGMAEVAASVVVTDSTAQEEPATPRKSGRAKKKVSYTEAPIAVDDAVDPGNESPLTDLDVESVEEPKSPTKKRRKRKPSEPVVYDIPPVEAKTTTFKGRLGYACLNTILRATKPDAIFCSRTCRKDTIHKNGLDFAKDLGKQNARDLCKLIQWNEENNIKFLRISSEMFPFASHKELGYSLEYAAEELKAAGDLAKKYGHRLTTHPGQFTQLASPKDAVVEASVRELDYHCQMMRYMGLDQDSVIIIHMGGVYGDKESTLARFKENYTTRLTDEMKARLVLENDEICYNPDDLLPICEELEIPIVFDYHHNWIYPSVLPVSELIPRINAIWHRKGIKPKQHLSSPRPGAETVMEKRAHADRCPELPAELPDDMDLMIEAKDKEQAVFHLYRIYELFEVKKELLRPEKPPKPFVRAGDAKDAGEDEIGDGEEGEGEGGSPTKKRKTRRTKKVKDEDEHEGITGEAMGVDGEKNTVDTDASVSNTAVKSKSPRKPRTSKARTPRAPKTKKGEPALELLNQEEYVMPVDGANVEAVEEDEHPEVVSAIEEENQQKGKKKSKATRKEEA
ncbi:UV-endonuclease UvdE [Panus rudis PR-1116 ss-1]|nr:UV-endonuclease UvdE [Panus rudis PR-1116 ss-1]